MDEYSDARCCVLTCVLLAALTAAALAALSADSCADCTASFSFPTSRTARRTKSVFIAPSMNGNQYAEGYQQDDKGRRVKVVKGNAKKSWVLLLEVLNKQYASGPDPVPAVIPEPVLPLGPLQLENPLPPGPGLTLEVPELRATTQAMTTEPSKVTYVLETTTPAGTERDVAEPPRWNNKTAEVPSIGPSYQRADIINIFVLYIVIIVRRLC